MSISQEERGLAIMTHLSGLAGYIIPLGGVIVPIIIWVVKKESAVISSIAKQALLLNDSGLNRSSSSAPPRAADAPLPRQRSLTSPVDTLLISGS
jgi:hypothetical protein